MEFKEDVIWRLDQTMNILLNNKKIIIFSVLYYLFLMLFLILSFNLISRFFYLWEMWYLSLNNLYLVILAFFIFVTYLMWLLSLNISAIKMIKDIDGWIDNELSAYVMYWFSKIIPSFVTYYYIFLYTLLVPVIVLIIFSIGVTYYLYEWWITRFGTSNIWILFFIAFIVGVALFIFFPLFIYYWIYRWTKAKFAIFDAIYNEDFTKESFNRSILLSKDKWFRVFGNLLLIAIIILIFTSIFNWIASSIDWILWFASFNYREGFRNYSFDPEMLRWIFKIIFFPTLWVIIKVIITWISMSFSLIFVYTLFRRLSTEKIPINWGEENIIISEEKSEIKSIDL